jgi:hypothetical protein
MLRFEARVAITSRDGCDRSWLPVPLRCAAQPGGEDIRRVLATGSLVA